METLAFNYYSASYEDPRDRQGKPFNLPNSQHMGLFSGALALLSLFGLGSPPSHAIAYRLGSRGETVVKIQQALGISADGIYGTQTERAVRNYQKTLGLHGIDGVAGTETLSALGIPQLENTGGQVAQAIVRTPDRQGVNLRSTPNGAKIGGLPDGSSVSLTGEERQMGSYQWVKIARGGWVAKTFLQPGTGQNYTPVPTFSQARVATPSKGGINVRRIPNGERIGSLPEGTIVNLTGKVRSQGSYIWVQTDRGSWIAKDFLREIDERSLANGTLSPQPQEFFADSMALNSAALTQNFQGDRGLFSAVQTTEIYDRPDGNTIGAVQLGEQLQVTGERTLENGIAWAKLADGSWVDLRAIGF